MKIVTGFLLFVLLALLSGDRCTYPPRLIAQAQSVSNPIPLLYQAVKLNQPDAMPLLLKQVIQKQHAYWFTQTLHLLTASQGYSLVMSIHDGVLRKQLLQQLAARGHQKSQFQHALLVNDPDARLRYLERLAEQGHEQAIVSTYYLAKSRNAESIASTWLAQAALYEPNLTLAYADVLWQTLGTQVALDYLRNNRFKDDKAVARAVTMIQQTSVAAGPNAKVFGAESHCQLILQIAASTIAGIEQAINIADGFRNDPRFVNFPVCINQPVWLDFAALDCSKEPNTRLHCKVEPLMALAENVTFTHMVVIGEQGIANVHNGLMYLDLQDDYQVFVHEFAHFAGFVDEYPLSASLAGQFCTHHAAPNLVFEDRVPDISNTHFAAYLHMSDELQLTETRTCQNTQRRAFKPVAETTFMEHHDVGVVPDVYLSIWRDTLIEPSRLTPIFVNFAQNSDAHGDSHGARYWWQKYKKYRL